MTHAEMVDDILAVDGGTPAFERTYPPPFYGADLIAEEEAEAVLSVIQSRSLFRYYGPALKGMAEAFERDFSQYIGVEHCLGVVSGTAALRCALAALGVGPGDEVIVPAYTFLATPGAVISFGATPVFAEVTDSFSLDAADAAQKITDRTRAIIPVHIHGVAADLRPILAVATQHNLPVLEDCAQGCGARYHGRRVGSWGDIAAFSFQQNKSMSTGEGGAVLTRSSALIRRARMFHDHGGVREGQGFPSFDQQDCFFGENLHMSEITAAIGCVQLKRLEGMLNKLRALKANVFDQLCGFDLPWRRTPDPEGDAALSLCLILSDAHLAVRWIDALRAEGVPAHAFYGRAVYECGLFLHPARHYRSEFDLSLPPPTEPGLCPRSEQLSRRAVWINLHPSMNAADADALSTAIRKVALRRGW